MMEIFRTPTKFKKKKQAKSELSDQGEEQNINIVSEKTFRESCLTLSKKL